MRLVLKLREGGAKTPCRWCFISEKYMVSMPYYEDGEYKTSIETYPKNSPPQERQYYDLDEEIVTDSEDIFDTDAWVDYESVNEYDLIEIEMRTYLPTISGYDLAHSEITMNFHEVLDSELVLDKDTADFEIYIGETPVGISYYRIVFDDDTGDGCNFHVDVNLTALYNDGYITDDMLDGGTPITIFFYVNLETIDEKNHYTSTIWYEIYDGYDEETRELLHSTADNPSVIYVYTFEIDIIKTRLSFLDEKNCAPYNYDISKAREGKAI